MPQFCEMKTTCILKGRWLASERQADSQCSGTARHQAARACGGMLALRRLPPSVDLGRPPRRPATRSRRALGATPPDKAASDLARRAGASSHPADSAAHLGPRFLQALRHAGSGNPINIYRPTTIGKASFANSVRPDRPGEGRQDLSQPLRRHRPGY